EEMQIFPRFLFHAQAVLGRDPLNMEKTEHQKNRNEYLHCMISFFRRLKSSSEENGMTILPRPLLAILTSTLAPKYSEKSFLLSFMALFSLGFFFRFLETPGFWKERTSFSVSRTD